MAGNTYVRIRIDASLRNETALVLDSLGLTISDVIRITLTEVVREKALPLYLSHPNPQTVAAIEEARAIKASQLFA
jgi:DNA-damage-inducible protein J